MGKILVINNTLSCPINYFSEVIGIQSVEEGTTSRLSINIEKSAVTPAFKNSLIAYFAPNSIEKIEIIDEDNNNEVLFSAEEEYTSITNFELRFQDHIEQKDLDASILLVHRFTE